MVVDDGTRRYPGLPGRENWGKRMEDDKDDRLSRSEYGDIKSSNFRKLILDALELLKSGQPQDAAFKIDDAMLSLPPDKRIGRGGIAEWAREWWQGHLAPIRANGGVVPGVVPDSFTRRNGGDGYDGP